MNPRALCWLLLAAAAPALAAEPAVRATPKGHPASTISTDDYPMEALRAEEQGTVAVRLDVGTEGRVTGCTVTASSGSASLDSATCRLLASRATFAPARDRKGRAVADTYDTKVSWRITASARDPALDAATSRWMACLLGEANRLARGPTPIEAAADQAFDACTAPEAEVTERLAVSMPAGAKPATTSMRRSLRPFVVGRIEEIRSSQ